MKEKIIKRLIAEVSETDHTLVHGKPGILIALSYYMYVHPNSLIANQVNEAIEKCVDLICDDIENLNMDGSLGFGITGVTCSLKVAEELGNRDKMIPDKWFDQLEEVVSESLNTYLTYKDYDLLRGATGNIVYLLRYSSNVKLIEQYVESLYENAVWVSNKQCYWVFYSYNEESKQLEYRDDIVNLGLAHGISGIISVLSEIFANNICKEKCHVLIKGALCYLKTVQNPNGKSQFTGIVYRGAPKQSSSRLGWCYGDSSIGLSIIKAGLSCNEKKWIEYGEHICLNSTKRTLKNADLVEHGICHGYLGAMHIYNRLYSATKNAIYIDRKNYWYDVAMKERDFVVDELGFYQTELNKSGSIEKYAAPGLLQGLAGIYLCLDSLNETQYPWDFLFLLNI